MKKNTPTKAKPKKKKEDPQAVFESKIRDHAVEYALREHPDIVDKANECNLLIHQLKTGADGGTVQEEDVEQVVNGIIYPCNYQDLKDESEIPKVAEDLVESLYRSIDEHLNLLRSIKHDVDEFRSWGHGTQGQMNLYWDSQRKLPITEYMVIQSYNYGMLGIGAWLIYLYGTVLQALKESGLTTEDCGKKYPPSKEFDDQLYKLLTGKQAPKKQIKSLPVIEKPVQQGKQSYVAVGQLIRNIVHKGGDIKEETLYNTEDGMVREKDLKPIHQTSIDKYDKMTKYIDEGIIEYKDFNLNAILYYNEANPILLSERQAGLMDALYTLVENARQVAEYNNEEPSGFITITQIAKEYTQNENVDVRTFKDEIYSFMKWVKETKIGIPVLEVYNETYNKSIKQINIESLFDWKPTYLILTDSKGKEIRQPAFRPVFNNEFKGYPITHYFEHEAGTIVSLPRDAINTSRQFMEDNNLTFTDRYGKVIRSIDESTDSPVIKRKIMGILAGFEHTQREGKAHVHTVGWEAIRECLVDESEERRSEQVVRDMSKKQMDNFKKFVEHFIEYCHKRGYIEKWEPWKKPGSKTIYGLKIYGVHLPKNIPQTKTPKTPGRKKLQ